MKEEQGMSRTASMVLPARPIFLLPAEPLTITTTTPIVTTTSTPSSSPPKKQSVLSMMLRRSRSTVEMEPTSRTATTLLPRMGSTINNPLGASSSPPKKDVKLRSLSRRLINFLRRRGSIVSALGPSKALPLMKPIATVMDTVIVFDPIHARAFAIASSHGIRMVNEDRHRVISNLELFGRALLLLDRNAQTLQDIAQKKILEQFGMQCTSEGVMGAVDLETATTTSHGSANTTRSQSTAPSFNLRKIQKQGTKRLVIGSSKTEFYGIYDGHGGATCSGLLALLFPLYLLAAPDFAADLPSALRHACQALNQEIVKREATDLITGGSTAITLVIRDKTAYLCHIGDCRAILLSKSGVDALTTDHKADNEAERKRVEAAGGLVVFIKGLPRVNGRLAVSRAFGDADLHEFITASPDIICHTIQPEDEYLVLASDGLWDTMSNEYVQSVIRNHPWLSIQEITKVLIDRAMELGSLDNITVLIVDLRPSTPAR